MHEKQDGLINHADRLKTIEVGKQWTGKLKGVIDLQVHWVLGHCDFAPNESANEEAKLSAAGIIKQSQIPTTTAPQEATAKCFHTLYRECQSTKEKMAAQMEKLRERKIEVHN